jgi:GrpB-like predicted nucleotidyltransferase (UPF0157 family)
MPTLQPVVLPYQSSWPVDAAALIASLQQILGPTARRVEHIGSTAIPGMAAKDIFDLQVSVRDLDKDALAFDAPLSTLGFTRSPYEADHVPAGLDDDAARWRKRLWVRRADQGEPVNLHVRLVGSPNERLALLFRDWFRSHPSAVASYSEFKRRLSALTPDTGSYAETKDPVVDVVRVAAEEWATSVAWQP